MISRLTGILIERRESKVLIETNGLTYEVLIPLAIIRTLDRHVDSEGRLTLITFHYHHLEPSRALPILIGFTNDVEREFFEIFIGVSGVGPKAAVRAMSEPIPLIARAIDDGNTEFLRSLPGIGNQRAKEIVAKLQGKVGKYALIPDQTQGAPIPKTDAATEAVEVLLQLQYKKSEAQTMVKNALSRSAGLESAEEILNEVYKQKVKGNGGPADG